MESWEPNSSDSVPYALLRLIPMREKSYSRDKGMDCCHPSQSGMTLQHSTEDPGEATSTWLLAGSPAKTLASLDAELESPERKADCGSRWPESLVKYDASTSSWKTRQRSLLGGLTTYSEIWPQWGSMRNGECWERINAVPLIDEKESGSLLPTPTTGDAYHRRNRYKQGGQPLSMALGGKPNPAFIEWLMGWPIGWTNVSNESEDSATDRFPQWLDLHGIPY